MNLKFNLKFSNLLRFLVCTFSNTLQLRSQPEELHVWLSTRIAIFRRVGTFAP
jgi:hypothetical protein